MNRFDRALALLLLLRSGHTHSASTLAQRFGVSPRTIYRDIATLAAVGVPVYAENGRAGGFRLLDGYFLPPITFSVGEAVSLLTGLALLGRLRVRPFSADLESAGQKLLAALPDQRRAALAGLANKIVFEPLPHDSFHPEPGEPPPPPAASAAEAQVITTVLQSLLDQCAVEVRYQRAGADTANALTLAPLGLLWDRDLWYLVAQRVAKGNEAPRLWRADRVQHIRLLAQPLPPAPAFELNTLLGRRWLTGAMAQWAASNPVQMRLTAAQAERLQRDWYYGHARFDPLADGTVRLTYGEVDPQLAFALLRWLGPGAELLAPADWRAAFAAELRAMLQPYAAA